MNNKTTLTALALSFALLPLKVSAQPGGSLTPPPGEPTQTMKSLDQIEPRTPLVDGAPGVNVAPSGTIIIAQSGSYYLTENLSVTSGNGITINASGVTLNLQGFTITSSSVMASGDAININGSNIFISNGSIISGTEYNAGIFSGGGFENGVIKEGNTNTGMIHVKNLIIRGCSQNGIYLPGFTLSSVQSCYVEYCGSTGIRASNVSHSLASTCGVTGINAELVSHCKAQTVSGTAIDAGIVSHSYGVASGGANGIKAQSIYYSRGLKFGAAPGFALQCDIAVGCTYSGGQDIDNKYLMP